MLIAEIEVEGKLNKDADDDDTDNSSSKRKLERVISFCDVIFAFSLTCDISEKVIRYIKNK
jgi:hypothetical protein